MTVSNANERMTYVGDGTVATYAFTFRIFTTADLEVVKRTAAGVESVLVLTSDYTVTGAGVVNGGTITLVAGNLASGDTLVIHRQLAFTQLTSVRTFGPTFQDLEDTLDRDRMIDQQLQEQLDRSLHLPISELGSAASTTLPSAASRALSILGFDIAGAPIAATQNTIAIAADAAVLVVDTIAALKAITAANRSASGLYQVRGYFAAGDGGGGLFRFVPADVTADNGGTVLAPSVGTGRWNRVYTGHINPRWFGATGTADDTSAIVAAIAAAVALSPVPTVEFPAGNYIITPLAIAANNVSITLDRMATLKAKAAVATALIVVTGSGFRMYGGAVDCTAQVGGDGIQLRGDDCRVIDTKVTNAFNYGIHGFGANKIRVDRCEVVDSGSIGIFAEPNGVSIADVALINNRVDRTGKSAGAVVEGGIKVHGGGGGVYTVADVQVSGNRVAMPVNPTDNTSICIEVWGGVNRAGVVDNRTTGGAMGISMDTTHDGSVAGNTCYNFKLYGIEAALCTFMAIIGNAVNGNALGLRGIVVDNAGCDTIAISGNAVRGCTTYAIHVSPSGSAANITINGNTIYHIGVWAINVSLVTGFVISGNVVNGDGVNSLKGIFLDTSSKGTISGNSISNQTQDAIQVFSASAGTYDYISVVGNSFFNCTNIFTVSFTGGGVLGANCDFEANTFPMQLKARVVTPVATYVVTYRDHTINADATAGAFTVTLPTTQVSVGQRFIIRKKDVSVNAVTIGGTVDGAVNPTLAAQYDKKEVEWNGTNYYSV